MQKKYEKNVKIHQKNVDLLLEIVQNGGLFKKMYYYKEN